MDNETIKRQLKLSLRFLPDRPFIRLYFRLHLHRRLDMKNPVTFNEKLQWMKFNWRSPLLTIAADKYAVRRYVEEKIGGEHLVPLLGVWDRPEDIDPAALPEQFVLKCSHDCGSMVLCRDRSTFDWDAARKKLGRCLRQNFYPVSREYQYRNIIPRIVCEQFISEDGGLPPDYKLFCFNGKPDCIVICLDRYGNHPHVANYFAFDRDWNFLPYHLGQTADKAPDIPRPENLEEMFRVAETLSRDFFFARIDLYNIRGKIYFGEITLSPNSGFLTLLTPEADRHFGELLEIPYWSEIQHTI